MVEWEEPFPTSRKVLKNRWLDAFAQNAPEAELGRWVLAEGNFLWHLFSAKLVPCLEGEAAKKALAEVPDGNLYVFYYEYPPEGAPLSRPISKAEALALPEPENLYGADWYLVDKDFTWTYVHTHEGDLGPYFCQINK